MNNNSFWFYIESYVHLFLKNNDLLLYNTLSGEIIENKDNPTIVKFVRRLSSKKNFMSMKLKENYLKSNPKISEFIKRVRKKYMGDLIDVSFVPIQPFVMSPLFNLMKDPARIKKESTRSIGENIISYLKEISIYINSECNLDCQMCNDAYKQFLFCHKEYRNKEIDIQNLSNFFSHANLNSLIKINVLGGDIFKHSKLKDIVGVLRSISVPKVFHIHYKNFIYSSDKLKFFDDKFFSLRFLINSPIDLIAIELAIKFSKNIKNKCFFIFTVQQESDIESINSIIKKYKLNNFLLIPYFNGKNISFFKKFVYIKSKKMISESKPTKKDIFSRMVFNTTNFGKIFIKSDGQIFGNFNFRNIGKLGKDTLHEILYKEMYHGKSWRKLRPNVIPCKSCVFNLLCPPLSNYEYVIGKNNLCCIWDKRRENQKEE